MSLVALRVRSAPLVAEHQKTYQVVRVRYWLEESEATRTKSIDPRSRKYELREEVLRRSPPVSLAVAIQRRATEIAMIYQRLDQETITAYIVDGEGNRL